MNGVVTSSGDVLHHHHALNVSVGGTDEEGDLDASISPDDEGRGGPRRPARGQSRIEFERLAAFFHVPINEAAKGLGVCATVLKKVCRKHGIPRWPHRKIKKLDTMLAMLETAANKPGNPQHDDDVRKKMEAVMRDRAVLMTEGKLVGEGKSDGRRGSKAEGKRDRKRKKPDDDDDDENELDNSRSLIASSSSSSYTLSHSHSGSEQDLLQSSGQMVMNQAHMGHMGTIDTLNGGYHMGMSAYPPGTYGSYPGPGAMAVSSYPYNSLFWNGTSLSMPGNVSLPGVHSISSGVISSTTGMMMHNLPPPNLSMATPISPITPPLSASSPLPIPHNKHSKLSHSDVLLDVHHNHYASSSPYGYHHRSTSAPHLAYSDFAVQHDSSEPSANSSTSSLSPSSSHFRLFSEVPLHPPTSASE